MTTEQKAKAYDEAIERASKLRVQNPFDTVSQMMEHVFPELCESEDEKIIKEIISIVKSYRESCITEGNHRFDDCISWLEKQGNQNHIEQNLEMVEALRTEYEKGRADAFAQMQKEWSEEDEVKINRIVACLENLNVADNDILLKDVDWLKSIKERYTWKPSDEQMRALEYIIDNAHNTSYSCKIAKELLEQLKKLKGE